MIEHVYRRAAAARSISRVIVATDDERIAERRPGASAATRVMTSPAHQSGTDRLAEVAASLACDVDRQRPGRRAAARPGDDRRRGRAVRRATRR